MKKRHPSLAFQILVLCLSPVILISIVLSVVFMSNISRITAENLRSRAEITMRYLNMDIQHALAPSYAMTSHTAAAAHAIPNRQLMFDIYF